MIESKVLLCAVSNLPSLLHFYVSVTINELCTGNVIKNSLKYERFALLQLEVCDSSWLIIYEHIPLYALHYNAIMITHWTGAFSERIVHIIYDRCTDVIAAYT